MASRISKQYPRSEVGAALQRILQTKGPYHDIPDTTVTRLFETTYMDRQVIQDTLRYLSSRSGLPNRLKLWSLARRLTYISGFGSWRCGPQVRRSALEIVSSTVSSKLWLPWERPTTVKIKEMRKLDEFLTAKKRPRNNCFVQDVKYIESATC